MKREKNLLRDKYRQLRKESKSDEKDDRIYKTVITCEDFYDADTVFTYYSVGSEASTRQIIRFALDNGKNVAVPKCTDKNGAMEFYFIKDTEQSLIDGVFSLKEPDLSVCDKAFETQKSVCLVPAFAFDTEGYRLGYGGGYYDRFLVGFKGRKIGLCYEECLCSELPRDKFDIKVNMIITDKKIYKLK